MKKHRLPYWFNSSTFVPESGRARSRLAVLGTVLLLLLVAMLTGTGCTTLSRPEELAWQGTHLVDVLQTNQIRNTCIVEGNPVVRGLLGQEPQPVGVVLWGAGSGLAHLVVSDVLLNSGWRKTYAVWQAISIGTNGVVIANNHRLGLRVTGNNKAEC